MIMSRENVSLIVGHVLEDFGNMLTDVILEDSDSFPYTCACVRFVKDMDKKGIKINLNCFDSTIIDNVYKEFISFLAQ